MSPTSMSVTSGKLTTVHHEGEPLPKLGQAFANFKSGILPLLEMSEFPILEAIDIKSYKKSNFRYRQKRYYKTADLQYYYRNHIN